MWQANVLNNLGFLQNLRGQYEQAALSFERSLQYSRLAMYPRGEGFVLISLGDLYRDLRSYNEAHQAYQMAQSVAEATHDNSLHIYLAISQTTLHRIEKKFDEAAEQLSIAEKMAREGGSNYEMDLCRLENCFS